MRLVIAPLKAEESLAEQSRVTSLWPTIKSLVRLVDANRDALANLRVHLISSTDRGGGVAEMLPPILNTMKEFGVTAHWWVIDHPNPELSSRFFSLTKAIHNLIHASGEPLADVAWPWMPSGLTSEQRLNELHSLFQSYAAANAEEFLTRLVPDLAPSRDVIVIHDPQPAAMVLLLRSRFPTLPIVWRCHIGLDTDNAATRSAWDFLAPYLASFDALVFSAPEYIRPAWRDRSFVIHPGISIASMKNKELGAFDVFQVLMRAGLMAHQRGFLESRGCSLVEPPFAAQAAIYASAARRAEMGSTPSPLLAHVSRQLGPEACRAAGLVRDDAPPACAASTAAPLPHPSEEAVKEMQQLGHAVPLCYQDAPPVPVLPVEGEGEAPEPATEAAAAAIPTTAVGTALGTEVSQEELQLQAEEDSATADEDDSVRSLEPPSPTHHLVVPTAGGATSSAGPRSPTPAPESHHVWPDEGIAFFARPIVTQVSRWDALKGWDALMDAWVLLKSNVDEYSRTLEAGTVVDSIKHDSGTHRRTLKNALLVLAGPDPSAIQDDPEGLQVLRRLKAKYDALPRDLSLDIAIVELPMQSTSDNALIVNALQRASILIVQNSLREGFGLTATEAMAKRVAFVGTEQAVGLRTQVRHGVDGILVRGNPADPVAVAHALNLGLGNATLRDKIAVNGQRRALEEFLIFRQLREWLHLCIGLLRMRDIRAAAVARVGPHRLPPLKVPGDGGGGGAHAAPAPQAAGQPSAEAAQTAASASVGSAAPTDVTLIGGAVPSAGPTGEAPVGAEAGAAREGTLPPCLTSAAGKQPSESTCLVPGETSPGGAGGDRLSLDQPPLRDLRRYGSGQLEAELETLRSGGSVLAPTRAEKKAAADLDAIATKADELEERVAGGGGGGSEEMWVPLPSRRPHALADAAAARFKMPEESSPAPRVATGEATAAPTPSPLALPPPRPHMSVRYLAPLSSVILSCASVGPIVAPRAPSPTPVSIGSPESVSSAPESPTFGAPEAERTTTPTGGFTRLRRSLSLQSIRSALAHRARLSEPPSPNLSLPVPTSALQSQQPPA